MVVRYLFTTIIIRPTKWDTIIPNYPLLFRQLLSDVRQALQRRIEGVVLLCEMQADIPVLRLPEEAGACLLYTSDAADE
mgnify:CR=1 FL=1